MHSYFVVFRVFLTVSNCALPDVCASNFDKSQDSRLAVYKQQAQQNRDGRLGACWKSITRIVHLSFGLSPLPVTVANEGL